MYSKLSYPLSIPIPSIRLKQSIYFFRTIFGETKLSSLDIQYLKHLVSAAKLLILTCKDKCFLVLIL